MQFAICGRTMGKLIGCMCTTLAMHDVDSITMLLDGEKALM